MYSVGRLRAGKISLGGTSRANIDMSTTPQFQRLCHKLGGNADDKLAVMIVSRLRALSTKLSIMEKPK